MHFRITIIPVNSDKSWFQLCTHGKKDFPFDSHINSLCFEKLIRVKLDYKTDDYIQTLSNMYSKYAYIKCISNEFKSYESKIPV